MQCKNAIAVVIALSIGSAVSAESSHCPKWERGARYPWQSNAILRDDRFAWVLLDVDDRRERFDPQWLYLTPA